MVTLIMLLIAGSVVNWLGLGTSSIGLLSLSGVPARLNWVTPAPGNWFTAVPSSNKPTCEEISPAFVASISPFTGGKYQGTVTCNG